MGWPSGVPAAVAVEGDGWAECMEEGVGTTFKLGVRFIAVV